MTQRLRDYRIDHRVIVVDPTPAMQKLRDEISAMQQALTDLEIKYHDLEEVEQRRQFHAFKRVIRENADRNYDKLINTGA